MTPGFSRLSVTGYRRLKAVNISLRPLNVLIGANGIGKSSLLDVFDLLAASAGGSLQSTVTDLGGMASLLTADGKTNVLTFDLQMDLEDAAPIEYKLRMASEAVGYTIANETLNQYRQARTLVPFKYIDAAGPADGWPPPPNPPPARGGGETRQRQRLLPLPWREGVGGEGLASRNVEAPC